MLNLLQEGDEHLHHRGLSHTVGTGALRSKWLDLRVFPELSCRSVDCVFDLGLRFRRSTTWVKWKQIEHLRRNLWAKCQSSSKLVYKQNFSRRNWDSQNYASSHPNGKAHLCFLSQSNKPPLVAAHIFKVHILSRIFLGEGAIVELSKKNFFLNK